MRISIRFRAMWLTAMLLLLVVALTLTSCGAFGRGGAGNNGAHSSGGRTTTSQTQAQATPDLQDIEGTDQSLQTAIQSLQGISTDANTDYSSQDTPQQP